MFKIGQRLSIETFKDGEVDEQFQCRIVEVSQKTIYIDYPVNERTGRSSLFLDGSEFKVSYVHEDGNVYTFSSEVMERKKIKIPVLAIHKPNPKDIRKIQRREYVRVDVSLDVAIHPYTEELNPLMTRTIDISGGGVAVVGDGGQLNYQPGDQMKITLVLPFSSTHYNYLLTDVEVVRCIMGSGNEPSKITYKFVNITDQNREKIIKYCFEKQLENRRKTINR
ncbi:flagellar brake protein [Aquisalibacillus elongatus]|uniref:C-di-GMP-binding flagellar brake protein YcgR n=1 Tax=Aquisalibacillus elongatus TaxID=485577 RepID=A0A3N5BDJ7_9BACI|nr:flagellar brake domain-containing protein [Aquisalibacillus elongatus]RPF55754.1 c-di-GMP-binding flagellar brake protein YcgR [Aquisalibacillus elongatus]